MGVREDSKDRTRRAIESAAISLYRSTGPSNTTIDDICAKAGIGRRTFFRYFSTKDEVLISRLRIDISIVQRTFQEVEDEESLITTLLRSARAVLHDQAGVRDFVDVVFGSPGLRNLFLGMLADFEDQLTPMIAHRLGLGSQDEEPRLIAAMTVCGFRVGLLTWLDRPRSTDPFPEVKRVLIRSLEGLLD